MEYNMDYCRERYARIASAMGISFDSTEDGARRAVETVKQLAADVNLPTFGVETADIEELAFKSFVNGSNENNPRPMSKDDYLTLFDSMM
jgi:alcohol dehydrogenase